MKRWSMAKLFGLCAGLVLIYVLFCIGLRQWQTRLVFFPDVHLKSSPEAVGLAYEGIGLPVGNGEHQGTVNGWWISSAQDPDGLSPSPVVLYLYGNGSNVGDLTATARRFHDLGWNCLFIDYRGYGLSGGAFPAEERVYEDAEAAWNYLVDSLNISPDRIVVYGHSLGGAIAIELATRQPQMAGLIVEGSFTSMLDMAKLQPLYQLFPLDWMLTQRFESLEKVGTLRTPLLILHGTDDETIPYQMSQQLYDATQESVHQPQATMVLIPNAGHNDLPEVGGSVYTQSIREFIEGVTLIPISKAPL